ncbi:DUF418 domain-containing protein [Pseudonocardiaceae bacterium YIM PH 21723]|nr:DUF418 domain-containing protein [Pseudonocardiaceae bacterium YIM PH 21723]
MSEQLGPVRPEARIAILDVLRGFALFGILMVNISWFAFGDRPVAFAFDRLGEITAFGIGTFFQGKFYVLFSLLFGYGFAVAMRRAGARGVSIVRPWTRRLLMLVVLGAAHGVLLFNADILTTYGVVGLVLLACRNLSPRAAIRLAMGLLLLLAVIFGVLTWLRTLQPAVIPVDHESAWNAYRGTVGQIITWRAEGYVETLEFQVSRTWPIVLAMFLLGMVAGRLRLLDHPDRLSVVALRRVLRLGLLFGLPPAILFGLTAEGVTGSARSVLILGINELTAPLLTVAYVACLVLVWRTRWGAVLLAPVGRVGRLALTGYLSQSLICAFLFTGYGFGLVGRLPLPAVVPIVIAIYLVQLVLSSLYLRRFRMGPVEWVLRKVTYSGMELPPNADDVVAVPARVHPVGEQHVVPVAVDPQAGSGESGVPVGDGGEARGVQLPAQRPAQVQPLGLTGAHPREGEQPGGQ